MYFGEELGARRPDASARPRPGLGRRRMQPMLAHRADPGIGHRGLRAGRECVTRRRDLGITAGLGSRVAAREKRNRACDAWAGPARGGGGSAVPHLILETACHSGGKKITGRSRARWCAYAPHSLAICLIVQLNMAGLNRRHSKQYATVSAVQ
jgi:hypothetical protein